MAEVLFPEQSECPGLGRAAGADKRHHGADTAPMKTGRVLLADSHRNMREGVHNLLEALF